MKSIIAAFMLLFSLNSFATVYATGGSCCSISNVNLSDNGSRSINFKGSTLVIKQKHDHPRKIEITEEYYLRVDGKTVDLDSRQKEYVQDYYDYATEIIDDAKDIGIEGGKIGVAGAKIGIEAVAGVFKLILPGYSSDDLERDMDRESAKLEARADRLEAKANALERKSNRLSDMFLKLQKEIPELRTQ